MFWRMSAIIILLVFYGGYIGKMVLQRKMGIRTDQIAKREKLDKIFYTELLLKIATYSVVPVEVVSILAMKPDLPAAFGEDYLSYKKCVCRYLGRKE